MNGKSYSWKFHKNIFIINNEIDGSFLVVDFGWFDAWLYVNDKENRPPDFEPKRVISKSVSESIYCIKTRVE